MPICRVCGRTIDKDNDNEEWIMPSRNYYYHTRCYEEYAKKKKDASINLKIDLTNEQYFDMLYDFLFREQRIMLDMQKVAMQWKYYLKQGYTAKGMYYAVRYFHEQKHPDPKKRYDGIGIIPYVYHESCAYWVNNEYKYHQLSQEILTQLSLLEERKTIRVSQKKSRPRKALELDIEEGEDNG